MQSNQIDQTVSRQWASRPDDQRFLTLADLAHKVNTRKLESRVVDIALDVCQVSATTEGEIALRSKSGPGANLTHFAFGQLCARAKAPAGYLRSLPAELAVAPLQWSLEHHESESDMSNDARVLVRKNGHINISAITSCTYGRIWDADVVNALVANVDTNVWKVPAASYDAKDPKRATTLYASDRDVFIFLVNESHVIEADGERINRGFYVWNSEVGAASFGIATFTYDYVCDNRIIWGQKDFKELVIRHTAGGPMRFTEKAMPLLASYVESSGASMVEAIRKAKRTEVGTNRDDVLSWMKARGFTQGQARASYDAAERDPRGYNPRSVWGLVQGATDHAHGIAYTNDRTDLEARAGSLLEAL